MSTVASQITGVSIVYSTVCSGADQINHQSSALLAFVRGIYRWPVNSPHKGPVTRKMFPFDDVIMAQFVHKTMSGIRNHLFEEIYNTCNLQKDTYSFYCTYMWRYHDELPVMNQRQTMSRRFHDELPVKNQRQTMSWRYHDELPVMNQRHRDDVTTIPWRITSHEPDSDDVATIPWRITSHEPDSDDVATIPWRITDVINISYCSDDCMKTLNVQTQVGRL